MSPPLSDRISRASSGVAILKADAFQNLAHFSHLLSIVFGEPARADPERVLHADAHIATHRRGLRRDPHLRGAAPKTDQ
jgi:hypothetical protein